MLKKGNIRNFRMNISSPTGQSIDNLGNIKAAHDGQSFVITQICTT
jgi:hypothetical protein